MQTEVMNPHRIYYVPSGQIQQFLFEMCHWKAPTARCFSTRTQPLFCGYPISRRLQISIRGFRVHISRKLQRVSSLAHLVDLVLGSGQSLFK